MGAKKQIANKSQGMNSTPGGGEVPNQGVNTTVVFMVLVTLTVLMAILTKVLMGGYHG